MRSVRSDVFAPRERIVRARFRQPEFWLRLAAYALPLAFFGYVLYWNVLPFGYAQTYTITVGVPGDTNGTFSLEPSENLSGREIARDGSTYRVLNGLAYALFEPTAVLKNAHITVSVDGDGVSLIPPYIDFDPNSVSWDWSWDFEHGAYVSPQTGQGLSLAASSTNGNDFLIAAATPAAASATGLTGSALPFNGYLYLDGRNRLELPGSADRFEQGPFTVYADWTPEDPNDDFQEIVGHYNWELIQDKNDVKFQVGRMDGGNGPFYTITCPIDSSFFNKRHTAVAIYSPAHNGLIELYVDGSYIDTVTFGTSTISTEYNGTNNLTFGKAAHGESSYFKGKIYRIALIDEAELQNETQSTFTYTAEKKYNDLELAFLSTASSTLRSINLTLSE